MGPEHPSQDPETSFFSKTFIKNGFDDTIHTFKNYFTIVCSVFSNKVVFKQILSVMNGLLSTKIKKIKLNIWHKIREQLETNLDSSCASTLK